MAAHLEVGRYKDEGKLSPQPLYSSLPYVDLKPSLELHYWGIPFPQNSSILSHWALVRWARGNNTHRCHHRQKIPTGCAFLLSGPCKPPSPSHQPLLSPRPPLPLIQILLSPFSCPLVLGLGLPQHWVAHLFPFFVPPHLSVVSGRPSDDRYNSIPCTCLLNHELFIIKVPCMSSELHWSWPFAPFCPSSRSVWPWAHLILL